MDDEFGDGSVTGGSSIFPFLSVLFCTLGALILILIAGSLNATVADATQEQKFAKISEEHGRMAKSDHELSSLEALQKRAEDDQVRFQRERKETIAQIQGEQTSLDQLRREQDKEKQKVLKQQGELNTRRVSMREWKKKFPVIQALFNLQADIDKLKKDRESVKMKEEELKDLAAMEKQLEAENKKLRDEGAAVKVSFRVKGIGAGHAPVYHDLTDKGLFVHRKSPMDTGGAPATQADRVVTEKAASLDKVARDLARGPGDEFALLLVRPGQQKQLRAAERSLMRRRVPFILEPADQAWKLTIKDGNEAEAGAGDPILPEAPPE